jgi:hypothetical protein
MLPESVDETFFDPELHESLQLSYGIVAINLTIPYSIASYNQVFQKNINFSLFLHIKKLIFEKLDCHLQYKIIYFLYHYIVLLLLSYLLHHISSSCLLSLS